MYKKTSQNMQRRDRERAAQPKTKTLELDEIEKAQELLNYEREELTRERLDHQSWLARNRNINFKLNYSGERSRRIDRITEITARVQEIKREMLSLTKQYEDQKPLTYVEAYYRAAKAILPDTINSRIDAAAIALLAERNPRRR